MFMAKKNVILLLVFGFLYTIRSIQARPLTESTRIPLIDTTYRSAESYRSLLALAEAAGITMPYLVPSTHIAQETCGADGVFLALDEQFIKHTDSAYAQLVIAPLKQCLKNGDKVLGLLVPATIVAIDLTPLLKQFGIDMAPLAKDINAFLTSKKHCAPLYTTAHYSAIKQATSPLILEKSIALPKRSEPAFLRNNMPLGITCTSGNITLIINTIATLTFSDIQEDGAINPLDPEKRKTLLKANLHMLADIQHMVAEKNHERVHSASYSCINTLVNTKNLPVTCTAFKEQQGSYKWTSKGIACGWMSVDYDKAAMTRNLAYLAQSNIDALWLELPIGLYKNPQQFDEKMHTFASQLLTAYQKEHHLLPKIIIDFNLGAILSSYTRASNPIDIYGATYANIPAPLDYYNFWKPAVLDVLGNVCKRWATIVGPLVPIDGVMFNLYFWHEKTTMPFYNNLIDVSDTAWNWYLKNTALLEPIVPATERSRYLISHDKLSEYFGALEYGAYDLAQMVTHDIETIVPCAMIGVYTNTPLDMWFYRGFMRGLGSKDRPLLLFTENLNFYGHPEWLKKYGICALHSTNVLLERFNNQQDIKLINKLAKSHDGLWYSRVSRIGEAYEPDKWWSAEATSLEPEKVIKLINTQARK